MALQRSHGLVLAGILEVPREGALTLNLGAGMAPMPCPELLGRWLLARTLHRWEWAGWAHAGLMTGGQNPP